ncbi:hypothetical protein FHS89_002096 [Rubricella aquisinus]|uniref:Outer membrane protein beta-barrel domain-containing protein n=1 Tax=Rubricella aquisinus TaxID=2028108 RepID=A0A840WY28_9RHOB|nr:outer membrane beta-barrel protein [Rubricella aquisinus]MBB5516070.1 hypothetical protein [Rubricella aquisinus]
MNAAPFIISSALVIATTSAAMACEGCAAPQAGFTIGGTASTTTIDPQTTTDFDATGFGVLARYTHPLSARIGVYGQLDYQFLDGKSPTGNTETKNGQSVAVGLHLQAADQVSLRASAGRAFVNSKHVTLGDVEANGTVIGLGLGYHWDQSSAIVGEYRTFNLDDRFGNADATSFAIGYEYRF